MNEKSITEKKWFKYVVIIAVLFIPFMYAFFYLRAYWDPYSHMEDISVALVNEDNGVNGKNKGKDLVKTLKNSKTLDLHLVDSKKASNGLNNKDYYAIITIPEDFSQDLLSAAEEEKTTATITYSPNQKTNYLASQIISRVVIEVEKEVRAEVSKEVVKTLSDKIVETSENVEEINNALSEIENGSNALKEGSNKLQSGTNELNTKYNEFDSGVSTLNEGAVSLSNGMKNLDAGLIELQNGVNEFSLKADELKTLSSSVNTLYNNMVALNTGLSNYVNAVNTYAPALSTTGNQLVSNMNTLSGYMGVLNSKTSNLNVVANKIGTLQNGVNTLKSGSTQLLNGTNNLVNGTSELVNASSTVKFGINELATGIGTLDNGVITLNEGIKTAHNEVDSKLNNSKEEIKKLDGLDTFVSSSVTVKEKDINKVDSYGTSFAPLFMSIALWIGSLMLFIILYYDANDRFKLFSRNAENKLKRTLYYILLAVFQGIVLGILLLIGLDFHITNYALYFISLILVACLFESIIEFLIVNFNDVGKFIGLILLVLQLASSGGTFPIETVSKGFHKLFNMLPMKYTIDLFKEPLISIEGNLLSKSLTVIIILFVVLFSINIFIDIKNNNKNNNKNNDKN